MQGEFWHLQGNEPLFAAERHLVEFGDKDFAATEFELLDVSYF